MSAVLLAAPDIAAEPELVSALTRTHIVRRCVDAVDLLGAAATGGATVAVVSSGLPRLSSDAISRLETAGVHVLGVHERGDDSGRSSLVRLGVTTAVDVHSGDIGALLEAIENLQERHARSEPAAEPTGGRIVAVWGPYGSPGRTSVAVSIADESARAGESVMLVDADPFGGAVGSRFGMLDESSGLVAACRRADQGALDPAGLARSARSLSRGLRVLTGLDAPDRWIHVRPAGLTRVLRLCRETVGLTVVDAGFCLDESGENGRGRTASTTVSLAEADSLVAVVHADHIGMSRFVAVWPTLRDLADHRPIQVVVNRVRGRAIGRDAQGQIEEALKRLCGIDQALLLPDDPDACDVAVREGRTLAEVAPRSVLRTTLIELTARTSRGEERPTAARTSAA